MGQVRRTVVYTQLTNIDSPNRETRNSEVIIDGHDVYITISKEDDPLPVRIVRVGLNDSGVDIQVDNLEANSKTNFSI